MRSLVVLTLSLLSVSSYAVPTWSDVEGETSTLINLWEEYLGRSDVCPTYLSIPANQCESRLRALRGQITIEEAATSQCSMTVGGQQVPDSVCVQSTLNGTARGARILITPTLLPNPMIGRIAMGVRDAFLVALDVTLTETRKAQLQTAFMLELANANRVEPDDEGRISIGTAGNFTLSMGGGIAFFQPQPIRRGGVDVDHSWITNLRLQLNTGANSGGDVDTFQGYLDTRLAFGEVGTDDGDQTVLDLRAEGGFGSMAGLGIFAGIDVERRPELTSVLTRVGMLLTNIKVHIDGRDYMLIHSGLGAQIGNYMSFDGPGSVEVDDSPFFFARYLLQMRRVLVRASVEISELQQRVEGSVGYNSRLLFPNEFISIEADYQRFNVFPGVLNESELARIQVTYGLWL